MANKASAKKALRQNTVKQARNKVVKDKIKKGIKDSRQAIIANTADSQELIKQVSKDIDKAIQKGVIKPNTGNRRKSRLMRAFHKAKLNK